MMTPPDNAFWYYLAYAVCGVTYAGYIASLWWRRRSVDRADSAINQS